MRLTVALLICTLASCSSPSSKRAEVQLMARVTDDYGEPFSGAVVQIGDAHGKSDRNGNFETTSWAPEGSPVRAKVVCPPDHRPVGGHAKTITVRHLRSIGGDNPGLSHLEIHFVCEPTVRQHVLIVRTDGRPGLPVMVTGTHAMTTNEDGLAAHVVSGAPGDEIMVVIDTSQQPGLRPDRPSRRMVLPGRSRFLIFDQNFEVKKTPARKKKKRRKARVGPRRL